MFFFLLNYWLFCFVDANVASSCSYRLQQDSVVVSSASAAKGEPHWAAVDRSATS